MKKVYQTIVDKGNGNCMQAVVASLFELELEQVPHFLEHGEDWYRVFYDFFTERNLDLCYMNKDIHGLEMLRKIAEFDGGINGFLYGAVPSQTFEDTTHAVVVDLNLNIVHDPNPNQKALSLSPEDVLGIYVTRDMIIGKTGEIFTHEEWDKLNEDVKDENTFKAEL